MGMDPAEIRRYLRARRLGARIDCLAETDSTNSDAARAGRAGAPEGTVVIADSQRRGRGRLGRSWASPPGVNLYCSVLLRPRLPAEESALLPLVAGIAVAEAVDGSTESRAGLKWPNDVVVGGRKIAGILCEMEVDGGAHFVVVGMGVNLNGDRESFPPEIRPLATSALLETGRPVERARFAADLLSALDARYEGFLHDGFSALLPAWSERDVLRGCRVSVRVGEEVVEGVATGITERGRLRVESTSGAREIVAGDVTVLGGYRASAGRE